MRRRGGRWARSSLSAIVIGGLCWCGWRWWDVHRYRNAMARIEDAMQAGRYAVAARDLSALLARSPGRSGPPTCWASARRREGGRGRRTSRPGPPRSPGLSLPQTSGRGPDGPAHRPGPVRRRRTPHRPLRRWPRVGGIGAPHDTDPDLRAGRPGGGGRAADRVAMAEPGCQGRRGFAAGRQPGAAAHGAALECAAGGSRSANTSTRSAGWLPKTIGSGWDGRTWRSAPARSMRRRGGSTRACGDAPRIRPSGGRGWTGR